jgi:hypothetical protein
LQKRETAFLKVAREQGGIADLRRAKEVARNEYEAYDEKRKKVLEMLKRVFTTYVPENYSASGVTNPYLLPGFPDVIPNIA